jgi:hypothetical protein
MFIRIYLIILTILFLNGCASTVLSPEALKIRTVDDKTINCCCTHLGIVTASQVYGVGWSVPKANESAFDEARNEAAKLNGNAIKIIDTQSAGDTFVGGGITYMVDVYNCDFEKVKN